MTDAEIAVQVEKARKRIDEYAERFGVDNRVLAALTPDSIIVDLALVALAGRYERRGRLMDILREHNHQLSVEVTKLSAELGGWSEKSHD